MWTDVMADPEPEPARWPILAVGVLLGVLVATLVSWMIR